MQFKSCFVTLPQYAYRESVLDVASCRMPGQLSAVHVHKRSDTVYVRPVYGQVRSASFGRTVLQ